MWRERERVSTDQDDLLTMWCDVSVSALALTKKKFALFGTKALNDVSVSTDQDEKNNFT